MFRSTADVINLCAFENKQTPIYVAIQNNDECMISHLVSLGARLTGCDCNGVSPLCYAVLLKKSKAFEALCCLLPIESWPDLYQSTIMHGSEAHFVTLCHHHGSLVRDSLFSIIGLVLNSCRGEEIDDSESIHATENKTNSNAELKAENIKDNLSERIAERKRNQARSEDNEDKAVAKLGYIVPFVVNEMTCGRLAEDQQRSIVATIFSCLYLQNSERWGDEGGVVGMMETLLECFGVSALCSADDMGNNILHHAFTPVSLMPNILQTSSEWTMAVSCRLRLLGDWLVRSARSTELVSRLGALMDAPNSDGNNPLHMFALQWSDIFCFVDLDFFLSIMKECDCDPSKRANCDGLLPIHFAMKTSNQPQIDRDSTLAPYQEIDTLPVPCYMPLGSPFDDKSFVFNPIELPSLPKVLLGFAVGSLIPGGIFATAAVLSSTAMSVVSNVITLKQLIEKDASVVKHLTEPAHMSPHHPVNSIFVQRCVPFFSFVNGSLVAPSTGPTLLSTLGTLSFVENGQTKAISVSPIHIAVMNRFIHPYILEYLLISADLSCKNTDDMTALDCAKAMKDAPRKRLVGAYTPGVVDLNLILRDSMNILIPEIKFLTNIVLKDPCYISTNRLLAGVGSVSLLIGGIVVSVVVPPASAVVLYGVVSGALIGAGISGAFYVATVDNFTWSGWVVQVGIGATTGAVSGGIGAHIGGLIKAGGDGMSAAQKIHLIVGSSCVTGSATGFISGYINYGVANNNWGMGALEAGAVQACLGVVTGVLSAGVGIKVNMHLESTAWTCATKKAVEFVATGTASMSIGAGAAFTMHVLATGDYSSAKAQEVAISGAKMAAVSHVISTGIRVAQAKICFVAGTLVATEHGMRAIETLQVADKVWSYHEGRDVVELNEVVATMSNVTSRLVELQQEGGHVVQTTPDHPFFVADGGWLDACQLQAGFLLRTRLGASSTVLDVRHVDVSAVDVFNIEVGSAHTYFVSQADLLVHNACGSCAAFKLKTSAAQQKKEAANISKTELNKINKNDYTEQHHAQDLEAADMLQSARRKDNEIHALGISQCTSKLPMTDRALEGCYTPDPASDANHLQEAVNAKNSYDLKFTKEAFRTLPGIQEAVDAKKIYDDQKFIARANRTLPGMY